MKKRSIDIASIIGFLMAIGLVVFGIITKTELVNGAKVMSIQTINMKNFVDPASIMIVVGGVIGCLFIMFPLAQFAKIPKHLKIIFMPKQYVTTKYITILVECAKKARMSGLLSLEEDANQMDDPFLKNSIQMIVDSVDPENVKMQMESWMDSIEERHIQECAFYEKGAALAPGFGMIGTLIGLINMMTDLSDIDKVGPNMAVALITTFYGSLLANVIFSPIASKLMVRHDEEYLCMIIVSEGVQAIQAGENPNLIEERLLHMLPEYKQNKLRKKGGGDGDDGSGKSGKAPKEKKGKK